MSSPAQVPAANRAPIEILISPFTPIREDGGGRGHPAADCDGDRTGLGEPAPWEESYHGIWHTTFTVGIGNYVLSWSRHLWVNDGLMAIFFFLVGLEIQT